MSGRGTHQAGGAVSGLLGAQVALMSGATPGQCLTIAVASVVTSGGLLSPDMDNSRVWRRYVDGPVPDEALGNGGPLQHRGITHWWGTDLALGVVWLVVCAIYPVLWPVAVGQAVCGWPSHLALDYVFGRQVRTPEGAVVVRAGIPFAPWWDHRGVKLRSSGLTSSTVGVFLAVAAAGQAFLLVTTGAAS